jgi:hypothetical protein
VGTPPFIAQLYLVFAVRDLVGLATLRLAEIVREQVAKECRRQDVDARPAKRAAPAQRRR